MVRVSKALFELYLFIIEVKYYTLDTMEFLPEVFTGQYGTFGLSWNKITLVILDGNKVTTFVNDEVLSTFTIAWDAGKYKFHGIYTYTPNPSIIHTRYYNLGVLHREDGPAALRVYNDIAKAEEWRINGRLHREGAPALIDRFNSGQISQEIWSLHGQWHREGEPARRMWHEDGQLRGEEWYINGKLHKNNGPSQQWWDANGQLTRIARCVDGEYVDGQSLITWCNNGQMWYTCWFVNNMYHKEDGPAAQEWYSNGQLHKENYYINGKFHREDGPAHTVWFEDGQKKDEIFYLHGEKVEPFVIIEVFPEDDSEDDSPELEAPSRW